MQPDIWEKLGGCTIGAFDLSEMSVFRGTVRMLVDSRFDIGKCVQEEVVEVVF